MEKLLIDALHAALPDLPVYHDFAPEEAELPLVVIKREGGAGQLFLDGTAGGYQVRFSVAVWHKTRLGAVKLSLAAEKALSALPAAAPLSAAESLVFGDLDARGMVQDFLITSNAV